MGEEKDKLHCGGGPPQIEVIIALPVKDIVAAIWEGSTYVQEEFVADASPWRSWRTFRSLMVPSH